MDEIWKEETEPKEECEIYDRKESNRKKIRRDSTGNVKGIEKERIETEKGKENRETSSIRKERFGDIKEKESNQRKENNDTKRAVENGEKFTSIKGGEKVKDQVEIVQKKKDKEIGPKMKNQNIMKFLVKNHEIKEKTGNTVGKTVSGLRWDVV